MKKEKFTLTQWRGIRGYSKEELALKSGVTSRTIATYEGSIEKLRNARYENIEKIAHALSISVDDIFLSPDSEKPKMLVKE
mgnify:CR=1 FL=1|jgi:transcriptional regulator with XRE-family HTH domain